MPWTIERLRLAIVALAVLLLVSIAGFIVYGRWQLRRVARDLPARLGVQIQQSTQGFIFSKTEQGRTLFTVHAARAVEYKSGGRVLLHDVEIDMYNRQDGKADTIAGNEFQFDPQNQIVQAPGEAHILLHPPQTSGPPQAASGAASAKKNKSADQIVRVTTHGLIFNQKTGVATSSGEVDFQVGDSSGQAIGCDYDSRQGHLLLNSQVVLRTLMQNRPAVVKASQAVYDRATSQVSLQQAEYASAVQQGTAGAATIVLRPDGSAQRLNAIGGVHLASADGTTVRASNMEALLNANSQPERIHFSGGVAFTQRQPGQQTQGNAQTAVLAMDGQGHVRQAVFDRQVAFAQRIMDSGAPLERTLHSGHLLLMFLPGQSGQAQLESALATGGAVFRSQPAGSSPKGQQTEISAETLRASFMAGNQLRQMDGTGNTRVATTAANGSVDTSTGDTLQVEFGPGQSNGAAGHGAAAMRAVAARTAISPDKGAATQSIQSAVQTGHVELRQTAIARTKGSADAPVSTASGARAEYRAASDTLTLTGTPTAPPVFRDAQVEMVAEEIAVARGSGTMTAQGNVQATLRPDPAGAEGQGGLLGGNQPVHVVAERAVSERQTETTVFTGYARLWQGGNMVEAPVIELSQRTQTLTAYGQGKCEQCVRSTFAASPAGASAPLAAAPRKNPAPPRQTTSATAKITSKSKGNQGPSAYLVISERLIYSDAERKASFLHNVEVRSSNGRTLADEAEIYLEPAAPRGLPGERNSAGSHNNSQPSSVERIVATGHVRLIQPGRYARGARLVYTASDGRFVLTGDDRAQPEVVDSAQGSVTGRVLTFYAQQEAVKVSGTYEHGTTTETRIQKK